MKICVVNPYFHPYMGGIERRIYETGKRLAAKGHDVTVVAGRLPGTEESEVLDGIKITRLPSTLVNVYNPPIIFSKGLIERVESIKPDLIDFHYRWAPDYTRAMNKLLERYPSAFTFHNTFGEGSDFQKPASYINDKLFMRYLKKYRHVICVSQFILDDIVSRGIPRERASVIYNGIEALPDASSARDGGYALFMGRMVKTKGLNYLLDALAIIKKEGAGIGKDGAGARKESAGMSKERAGANGKREKPVKVKLCGDGPVLDSLNKQAASLGIEDIVELPGRVGEEEKERLFSEASFFVLPSTFESFGIVLLEAMRWGKPCLASRTGGVPEVVGDAGILVEPRSPRALADGFNEMWSDGEKRLALGEKALERSRKFSWDGIASQLEKQYSEITNE